MSVHILDVGKGDCILINCEGKNVLIDAGEQRLGYEVVSSLRNLGVNSLDEVILTHDHSDHFGEMPKIFQSFPVRKVILPEKPFTIPANRLTIPAGISFEYGGRSHALGELQFIKLTPVASLMNQFPNKPTIGDDVNDTSQIWKLTFKNKSFLFLGDAGPFEIPALLNEFGNGNQLNADVLKIAHHGDSRSTTNPLLQAVQPTHAAISTSPHFMNIHNNETKTINTLQAYNNNIKINRTDNDGHITYATDGKTLVVQHGKNIQGQNKYLLHTIPFYHQTPLQQNNKAGGSNDNGWYTGLDNKEYLIKFTRNSGSLTPKEIANRAANEFIALKLYQAMSVKVPHARLVQDTDGNLGIALEKVALDSNPGDIAKLTGTQEAFAIDCFLANWDAVIKR
jgi:beta-lactamase superfamily II metal-dependent hydrolase